MFNPFASNLENDSELEERKRQEGRASRPSNNPAVFDSYLNSMEEDFAASTHGLSKTSFQPQPSYTSRLALRANQDNHSASSSSRRRDDGVSLVPNPWESSRNHHSRRRGSHWHTSRPGTPPMPHPATPLKHSHPPPPPPPPPPRSHSRIERVTSSLPSGNSNSMAPDRLNHSRDTDQGDHNRGSPEAPELPPRTTSFTSAREELTYPTSSINTSNATLRGRYLNARCLNSPPPSRPNPLSGISILSPSVLNPQPASVSVSHNSSPPSFLIPPPPVASLHDSARRANTTTHGSLSRERRRSSSGNSAHSSASASRPTSASASLSDPPPFQTVSDSNISSLSLAPMNWTPLQPSNREPSTDLAHTLSDLLTPPPRAHSNRSSSSGGWYESGLRVGDVPFSRSSSSGGSDRAAESGARADLATPIRSEISQRRLEESNSSADRSVLQANQSLNREQQGNQPRSVLGQTHVDRGQIRSGPVNLLADYLAMDVLNTTEARTPPLPPRLTGLSGTTSGTPRYSLRQESSTGGSNQQPPGSTNLFAALAEPLRDGWLESLPFGGELEPNVLQLCNSVADLVADVSPPRRILQGSGTQGNPASIPETHTNVSGTPTSPQPSRHTGTRSRTLPPPPRTPSRREGLSDAGVGTSSVLNGRAASHSGFFSHMEPLLQSVEPANSLSREARMGSGSDGEDSQGGLQWLGGAARRMSPPHRSREDIYNELLSLGLQLYEPEQARTLDETTSSWLSVPPPPRNQEPDHLPRSSFSHVPPPARPFTAAPRAGAEPLLTVLEPSTNMQNTADSFRSPPMLPTRSNTTSIPTTPMLTSPILPHTESPSPNTRYARFGTHSHSQSRTTSPSGTSSSSAETMDISPPPMRPAAREPLQSRGAAANNPFRAPRSGRQLRMGGLGSMLPFPDLESAIINAMADEMTSEAFSFLPFGVQLDDAPHESPVDRAVAGQEGGTANGRALDPLGLRSSRSHGSPLSAMLGMPVRLEGLQRARQHRALWEALMHPGDLRASALFGDEELTYEQLVELEDVKVTTPADVFEKLPTSTVVQGSTDEGLCSVCQCDYCAGDVLSHLPCKHSFHKDCIRPWLQDYSKKCPICKTAVC